MSSENGIKINRNQRRWHKYGKLIIGLAAAAAAIIVIICIAASASGGKKEQRAADAKATESVSQAGTDENGNVTESQAGVVEGSSLKLTGKPSKGKFTKASAFKNSVFMGDVFVNGLNEYGLIDDYYIWSSNYFTTEKAIGYVEDAAKLKPEKLFLMFGFDDSASRKVDETVGSYEKLIKNVKKTMPDTKVYIISELPVSKEFDEEEGDINQAVLDKVNSKMEKKALDLGVTYIEISETFKSGKNIGDDYTTDGYHIDEVYYPFVMNGIAELIK